MRIINALAALAYWLPGSVLAMPAADSPVLPWQRERPLREAAQSAVVTGELNPSDPNSRTTMSINNLKMHTVLWGTPDRITISLTKNNVWDRRLHVFPAPTLQDITEGAFAAVNRYYVGVKEIDSPSFFVGDIVNPASLAGRMANKSDAVSAWLDERLDDKTKASLDAWLASKPRAQELERVVLTNLAAYFNTVIAGPSIYDAKLFQEIRFRPETDELRARSPQGRDLVRLNRLLLEDAYPKELSRKPGNSLRPLDLGWLRKEGGTYDPYRTPMRYAFPCLKPVGQIIIGMDPLAGASTPRLTQSCANGVVTLQMTNGDAKASLQYVLGMTNNIYAIRGRFAGINTPVFVRLYRHQDTSHLDYMEPDGKTYTKPEAEADRAFNGPIDAPTSGTDGRYFWIRQKMPGEKTFPQGFEYVLMGVVATPKNIEVKVAEGQTGLGTPPPNPPMPWDWFGAPRPSIALAPGAAATATFTPGADGQLEAYITIVTTMDGPNLVALARKRLAEAEAGGFDGVARENSQWWNAFYDKREDGRVFHGLTGTNVSDNLPEICRSWTDSHGGGTKTDMTQLECSASYARPERDFQDFDGAPCYNEIFYTSRFVRNWGDSEDMWKQIVQHWMPGGVENARHLGDLPGMLLTHGYLPPVKPDKYVHTTIALEFCLGTMAELLRPAWDEWDYGGDTNYLRQVCYPMMKQMALFYAAYARRGADGYYHVIPCMEEERWGFYPEFSRNKDVISSVCLFRWGLTRAADAAELLGVDAGLSKQWREVAAQLPPYSTWQTTSGAVLTAIPGLEPRRDSRDHQNEANSYPTVLADEINLDSPQDQKDLMLRTVRTIQSQTTPMALTLLGVPPGEGGGRRGGGGEVGGRNDAETLLNSRSGRIYLFPAVPPASEVAYHNFQARGGFLVSACHNSNGVYYVEIQARRDNQCQLMNPWPGQEVAVHEAGRAESLPAKLDRSNGECLIFPTVAGHKYRVLPK